MKMKVTYSCIIIIFLKMFELGLIGIPNDFLSSDVYPTNFRFAFKVSRHSSPVKTPDGSADYPSLLDRQWKHF